MLYAKFVCTYMYTDKATYDVHAGFSVHICHSLIRCITRCITVLLILFSIFLLSVYKLYTQLMCIGTLYFTGISHTGTWLPGYWTFQQIYIRCILQLEFHLDQYHVDGSQSYTHLTSFITARSYPDVYPLLLHL